MTQDLGRLLFDQANHLNEQLRRGVEIGRTDARRDLQGLFRAYERALLDAHARIPTALHLAIEELKKKYGS
jgi:hypothetical protein